MYLSIVSTIVLTIVILVEKTTGATPIQQPSCEDQESPTFVCKGEELNGRCFCCGSTSHSEIFGWSWISKVETMTCSCSRWREEMGRNDVSIHCSNNGNYEKLQCDNDSCWCVEPTSGKPTERLYPRSMMKYLPCYVEQSSDLRQHYLRQCESGALARITVLRKLQTHGTYNTHINMPLCEYDGNYAKYRVDNYNIHCVRTNGTKIGNYESAVADILKTNCNCARDSVIYAEENVNFQMSCATNGNYNNPQMSNGMPYCVDDDGFPTTELGMIGENLNCS